MVIHCLLWNSSIGSLRNVHQFRLATFRFVHFGSAFWICIPGLHSFLNFRGSRCVGALGYVAYLEVFLYATMIILESFLPAPGEHCAGVCSRRWSDSGSEREVGCDSQE